MLELKSEFESNIQLQTFKTDNHHNSVIKYTTHESDTQLCTEQIYISTLYFIRSTLVQNLNISSLCNGILFSPFFIFLYLHPHTHTYIHV